jgi:Ca2+-binding EF-hand superfamily protein
MASDLIRRKLTHLFNQYDYNKNGVLEKEDFAMVGANFARMNGFAEGSEEYEGTVKREVMIWDAILPHCDANNDGVITLEEYITGFEAWKNTPEFETFLREYSNFVFDAVDTNKNGRMEFDEFMGFIYTKDKALGEKVFNALDTDKSGYLDRNEVLTAFREFFFTEDPNSPANYLFEFNG